MKLVTLQNKRVLEEINNGIEYFPDKKYNFMGEPYTEMFKEYYKKTGIAIKAAIWCWHTVEDIRNDKIPNSKMILYMEDFYYDDDKDIVILLDVPEEIVMLTDAYAWSSYASDSEEDRLSNPYKWDTDVEHSNNVSHIQGIIPTLKPEYILEYKLIEDIKNNELKWS